MIIIFPTDTVYGIGCPIYDMDSINKIYEIKKRNKDKPLACLVSNIDQIKDIAYINKNEEKLINKFMPGALTIILKAKDEVYNKIEYKTIGVRIPNNKLAIKLLNQYGPMLTTSVNESGMPSLNKYEEIKNIYEKYVDNIYYDDEPSSSISSTVIYLKDDDIVVLREGSIKKEELLDCIKSE